MIIIFDGREYKIKNDIRELEKKIMELLEEKKSDKNKYFSHVIVDGVEIYNKYEEYIYENYSNINELEIVFQNKKDLVFNILLSKFDYITNSIPLLSKMSDNFYLNPDNDDWAELVDFIEGLIWIFSSFSTIDLDINLRKHLDNYEDWNLYAKNIGELELIIEDFNEAVETKDSILIADLISYEIIPMFKLILDDLGRILKVEDF